MLVYSHCFCAALKGGEEGEHPEHARRMGRETLVALATGVVAVFLGGCGAFGGAVSATSTASPVPTVAPPPTPGVAAQVDRAKRLGPGFLDYCPRHEGAARAQYDVMLPGKGPIGGFCQTHISRQPGGDIITF
jgi:hypothetical protein